MVSCTLSGKVWCDCGVAVQQQQHMQKKQKLKQQRRASGVSVGNCCALTWISTQQPQDWFLLRTFCISRRS
jgi:hypothetical protein